MTISINDSDPCNAAIILRRAYVNLITGNQPATVDFSSGTNGVSQRTTFHGGNAAALKELLSHYEAACAQKTTGKPRRRAIRAGGVI